LGPLRVTTPARTLVDLSGRCDAETFEVAFHHCLFLRLTSLARMELAATRHEGRGAAGAPLLRELLTIYRDDPVPAESPLEVFARRNIAKAKLPPPVRQHQVVIEGAHYRIDLAYPAAMVAIEVDGYRWHSSRLAWDADRAKVRALERAGWTVVHGTYASVRIDPSTFVDEVAIALGATLGSFSVR
jgi:very-short-patch-repair endonuclease